MRPGPKPGLTALAVAFIVGCCTVLPAVASGPLHTGTARYGYAYAHQHAVAVGTRAYLSVHRPRVARPDYHSLAEVAVQSADGLQAVEVGWTVNPALYGDGEPRLFVFHWVDGRPACYNGCGYVQDHAFVRPGTRLAPGTSKRFAVRFQHGAWLVGYDGVWFGHFPAALWDWRFTRSGLVQWFGEVSGPQAPCAEMGSGRPAHSAAAATVSGIAYDDGPYPRLTLSSTDPEAYSIHRTGPDAFRYGGRGACGRELRVDGP